MLSTFNLSDSVHLVTLLIGVILLLKKVAEMERYHALRVFVLTSILSCIVIYFFLVYGLALGNGPHSDCINFYAVFRETEM